MKEEVSLLKLAVLLNCIVSSSEFFEALYSGRLFFLRRLLINKYITTTNTPDKKITLIVNKTVNTLDLEYF